MRRRNFPYWCYPNQRQFKIDRRRALKNAIESLKAARFASVYLPDECYKHLQRAHELLNIVAAKVSQKEWGR